MDSQTKKSYDPSKNDPKKISIENLKDGISERQTKRITYEAMLLRKTPQDLLVIAPFLYQNDNFGLMSSFFQQTKQYKQQILVSQVQSIPTM
ncbi:MAG: hypothetical protein WCJ33_10185, partial [Pseudomonadota bacterium]